MMSAPEAGELEADPVEAGELVLDGIWARQAPMLEGTGDVGTPDATPES
jgi:hypothetical protein